MFLLKDNPSLFMALFSFFVSIRFFKIFPLIGLHEIGLEKFARYINEQVRNVENGVLEYFVNGYTAISKKVVLQKP